jgi:hypothetical protein
VYLYCPAEHTRIDTQPSVDIQGPALSLPSFLNQQMENMTPIIMPGQQWLDQSSFESMMTQTPGIAEPAAASSMSPFHGFFDQYSRS